jgi:hypothetical protein
MRRWLPLVVLLLAPGARAAEAAPSQWVVVTAPAFRAAVEPLCAQRKAQGMHVQVVQTTDLLTEREVLTGAVGRLREQVNKLCREAGGPSYVLLVGAVEAGRLDDAATKVVPPLRGTVARMKGQPSDNGYGCPQGGVLPTVAVGRFPARTEDEARQMVAKTLAYERDTRPGAWRRRLTVLAGVPAFNPLVDRLVEGMALARLDRIDPCWSGRALYHNPQSRFCVPDARLHERALDLVQEGEAFTLYLGHSNAVGFWGGRTRFLDRDDWSRLRIPRGPGVLLTFGCNGCQLAGRDGEGYGVAAVRNPEGPVAVVGSHGICFAAMVELAADALFESVFAARPPERLGDAGLRLKQALARGPIDPIAFRLLDAVDGDAQIPLAQQRLEHLEMFLLLGDPALKLPVLPTDVELRVSEPVAAGRTITVRGDAPARLAGANVHLTLERPAGSSPTDLQPLPAGEPLRDRVMFANHERANRFAVASAETTVRDGRFEARLTVPPRLPWQHLTLRAYAATDATDGLGVLTLNVTPAAAGTAPRP